MSTLLDQFRLSLKEPFWVSAVVWMPLILWVTQCLLIRFLKWSSAVWQLFYYSAMILLSILLEAFLCSSGFTDLADGHFFSLISIVPSWAPNLYLVQVGVYRYGLAIYAVFSLLSTVYLAFQASKSSGFRSPEFVKRNVPPVALLMGGFWLALHTAGPFTLAVSSALLLISMFLVSEQALKSDPSFVERFMFGQVGGFVLFYAGFYLIFESISSSALTYGILFCGAVVFSYLMPRPVFLASDAKISSLTRVLFFQVPQMFLLITGLRLLFDHQQPGSQQACSDVVLIVSLIYALFISVVGVALTNPFRANALSYGALFPVVFFLVQLGAGDAGLALWISSTILVFAHAFFFGYLIDFKAKRNVIILWSILLPVFSIGLPVSLFGFAVIEGIGAIKGPHKTLYTILFLSTFCLYAFQVIRGFYDGAKAVLKITKERLAAKTWVNAALSLFTLMLFAFPFTGHYLGFPFKKEGERLFFGSFFTEIVMDLSGNQTLFFVPVLVAVLVGAVYRSFPSKFQSVKVFKYAAPTEIRFEYAFLELFAKALQKSVVFLRTSAESLWNRFCAVETGLGYLEANAFKVVSKAIRPTSLFVSLIEKMSFQWSLVFSIVITVSVVLYFIRII